MKKLLHALVALLMLAQPAAAEQRPINLGVTANDGTGDSVRAAFAKVNANTAEIYGSIALLTAALANKQPQSTLLTSLVNGSPLPLSRGGTGAVTPSAGLQALGGAPLDSPSLTGTPLAPTASTGTTTAQVATTAFVDAMLSTGPSSPNLWYNPDGALGDGTPKVVFNDGLSIYGPRRWIFQQVTLTPYVTGRRVQAVDGSTAIRMLNGYAASGPVTIGTGTKTFTVASGLNFAAGFPVTAVVASDLSKSMSGTVASYSGTTVTLNVTSATGSGSFTDWTIGAVGTTKQGQTKLVTTAASPAGSTTLSFADTSGVQRGANVEFAFDAQFRSINGIQRGTYVVSKTSTTVTLSQPLVTPAGATPGSAVIQGQQVTFYGNQGNYLFQDVQVADAAGFRYGTPDARDAWLSFDVVSSGLPNCTASMMMLGYKSISELGRSYVQSFPVTSTKTRITIKIRGDKVGAPGTWKAGYGANTWGGLWGTVGFVWESQGTATAQNIPDGQWSNAFAVGGSDQQTCDLTGTVGAAIDVSNVKIEFDKPTPYVPPTEQSYPSPRLEARDPKLPCHVWTNTGNALNRKVWKACLLPSGSLDIGSLLDGEDGETPALILDPDGTVNMPSYADGTLAVADGKVTSMPPGFTEYVPGAANSPGSATFGTTTGLYRIDAKTLYVHVSIPVTSPGSSTGVIVTNLPTACNGRQWTFVGSDSSAGSGKMLYGVVPPNSASMQIRAADGSFAAVANSTLNLDGFCALP